jgi:spore maturation protein CgeB
MKIVVFGLTISSSWGNGHATLWRGFAHACAERGYQLIFFEHDTPYYAMNRDPYPEYGETVFYDNWESIRNDAARAVVDADVAIVSSYCPDGIAASALVCDSPRPVSVFYDLDTPVTLAKLARGESTTYIGPRKLADFDLVLSFTGGPVLDALRNQLGARRAAPLYGHVDPDQHYRTAPNPQYVSDFSYLGTYAADRQNALDTFFVEAARLRPQSKFMIAGAQYPLDFPWTNNIYFVRHLAPSEHSAFFSSSAMTLNITRADMAANGWCPSGRLFEAGACATPIVSDWFDGLDHFLAPHSEILVVRAREDALAALDLDQATKQRIGRAARDRILSEHTSAIRLAEFERHVDAARAAPAPRLAHAESA